MVYYKLSKDFNLNNVKKNNFLTNIDLMFYNVSNNNFSL